MTSFLEYWGYNNNLNIKNKFTYIINVICIFMIILFLVLFITIAASKIIIILSTICFLEFLSVFVLLKNGRYLIAKLLMLLSFLFQEFNAAILFFPADTHLTNFLFIVAPVTFFIFDFEIIRERVLLLIINIITTVLLLYGNIVGNLNPMVLLDSNTIKLFSGISAVCTIGSILIVFLHYSNNIKNIQNQLHLLADTDGLTNILNRRALFNIGDNLYKLSKEHGTYFTMAIIDLDFFKVVNDTYGHLAGDKVLIQLTNLIKNNIRKHDLICRYGGEEFALILRDVKSNDIVSMAENLRLIIENKDFVVDDNITIKITISMGIADMTTDNKSFTGVLKNADKALYDAKESGRNCIVLHNS